MPSSYAEQLALKNEKVTSDSACFKIAMIWLSVKRDLRM